MDQQHDANNEKLSSVIEEEQSASPVESRRESDSADGARIIGVPKRYILLLMIFIGFVNIYAMRVNLNVALVAMVNNQTIIRRGVKIIKV